MAKPWLAQRHFRPEDGPNEVAAGLQRLVAEIGLDHWSAGLHRTPRGGDVRCQPGGLSSWPRPLLERYAARRYCRLDPVCELARRSHRPFWWGQGRFARRFAKPQRRVLEEMAAWGLTCGLAIPVRCARGGAGVFSVAADDPKRLRQAVRGQHERLLAAAFDAHDFLLDRALARTLDRPLEHPLDRPLDEPLDRQDAGNGHAVLTVRERECLSWTLEGRTAGQVADLLGLSAHTVNRHASSAARKLGCANKHHAAVRALREGLL